MQSLPEARLIIPAKEIFLEPAFSFIKTFAAGLGIEDSDLNNLSGAVEAVLKIIIDNNSRSEGEPLRITAAEAQGMLSIKIHNRGIPVVCGKNTDCTPAAAELLGKFRELSKKVDGLSTENLGRKGQVISIGKRLGKKALQKAFDPPALERLFPKNADKKIKIRRLKPQEASALSRLFYFVYGYNYINETIYYPEKLEAIMQDGRLISTAAVLPDGRIAGHVGLLKRQNEPPHFAAPSRSEGTIGVPEERVELRGRRSGPAPQSFGDGAWARVPGRQRPWPPVYEAALGLVDPALKSRGLFAKIFKKTMSIAGETPMHYLYFDFVTNHILSQKLISRYGTCDMALFLGCQTKEHQASLEKIGLGPDPEDMDRYTILFSIIPRVKQPFGKKICLPESLGSRLGFLLKPLGLTWYPASRIDTLTPEGGYKTEVQTAQKAVIFDMYQPGRQAAEKILDEWREYLNDGYEYAAVDVPLGGPGIGALYDLLSRNGFFVSGFIPYRFTERLGFRFQSLGHTKVAFDKIQIATASGKRLLETIVQEQTILT